MPQPFVVLATQNPVDFVGTYPLPEAQLDRFFMRISIGYPTAEEEADILEKLHQRRAPDGGAASPICTIVRHICAFSRRSKGVHTSKEVRAYISAIAAASRKNAALQLGVSTRAAISLLRAAQACALLDGPGLTCIPEDVLKMAAPVLAHRLVLSARGAHAQYDGGARASGDVLSGVHGAGEGQMNGALSGRAGGRWSRCWARDWPPARSAYYLLLCLLAADAAVFARVGADYDSLQCG